MLRKIWTWCAFTNYRRFCQRVLTDFGEHVCAHYSVKPSSNKRVNSVLRLQFIHRKFSLFVIRFFYTLLFSNFYAKSLLFYEYCRAAHHIAIFTNSQYGYNYIETFNAAISPQLCDKWGPTLTMWQTVTWKFGSQYAQITKQIYKKIPFCFHFGKKISTRIIGKYLRVCYEQFHRFSYFILRQTSRNINPTSRYCVSVISVHHQVGASFSVRRDCVRNTRYSM